MEEDFDYTGYPQKLNLGCGFDKKEGYLNIDFNEFHNPDLVADICNLEILPSGYYEKIIAYDVLEHITRNKTKLVLSEWNRLLKKSGTLHLQVPDLLGILSLLKKEEYQSIEKQEGLVHCLFGSQQYHGDFHQTGFTELILRNYLAETGFETLNVSRKDEWLLQISAKKVKECILGEFLSIQDHTEFIETAYMTILERMPDKDGFNYYVEKLKTGEMDKGSVLIALLYSDEKKKLTERMSGTSGESPD
jgi:predicted SAM-dependent methyltransferase